MTPRKTVRLLNVPISSAGRRMRPDDVEARRVAIRQLHNQGVSEAEIARQLSCSRNTVSRALKSDTRDARRKPKGAGASLSAAARAELRRLWEHDRPSATRLHARYAQAHPKGALPSRTVVAELIRLWRAEDPPAGDDADYYADLDLEDWDLVGHGEGKSLRSELGILRHLLRRTVTQLRALPAAERDSPHALRLQSHAVALIRTIAQVARAQPTAAALNPFLTLFHRVNDELDLEKELNRG